MTKNTQINILKELIEGVEELNGEFQEGWDKVIERGNQLLEYIKQINTNK